MAERKLLPCPFCGCPGEIYTGREFPTRVHVFPTEAEARRWLEKNLQPDSTSFGVYPGYGRRQEGKFVARFNRPGYLPRCTNTRCPARSLTLRRTEQQAIDLWNRRTK
jgi:hypothetical protein